MILYGDIRLKFSGIDLNLSNILYRLFCHILTTVINFVRTEIGTVLESFENRRNSAYLKYSRRKGTTSPMKFWIAQNRDDSKTIPERFQFKSNEPLNMWISKLSYSEIDSYRSAVRRGTYHIIMLRFCLTKILCNLISLLFYYATEHKLTSKITDFNY